MPTLAELVSAGAGMGVAGNAEPLSVEEVVTRSMPAVVKVETREASGSGFFVSGDTLLTNAHVIGSEKGVNVRFAGGQRRSAAVEQVWREVDLAVLKIDVVDPYQVFLAIAKPTDIKVGAEVIAIGSPLGFQNTVTRGIISGTRDFVYDRIGGGHVRVVQTDAAINPGNSGGPLIDRYGRVVGVNTFKIGGMVTGLGFAVEMSYARRMLGPSFALKSDTDQQRENALRKYEGLVRSLAQRADERETKWKDLRHMCYEAPSEGEPPVREWFVLWDGPHGYRDTPACKGWKPVFMQWAKLIHDALDEYETNAVQAGVTPDKLRQIRRMYNMSWPAWETGR
jgi:S1-C subfamily serine protease